MELCWGCLSVFIVLITLFLMKQDPKPIFGVYNVPGKWYPLKYMVFSFIYYLRKYSNKTGAAAAGRNVCPGQGVRALASIKDMEKPQQLSSHVNAFDAVFFISADSKEQDKGVYIVVGCERRPKGMCSIVFYIGIPGKGLLCWKKTPDTIAFGAEENVFGAEGLLITPIEPMKKWKISFKGQMKYEREPEKLVDVVFEAEWESKWAYFDYDTDLYGPAVIRSIAREPWSREYFQRLKDAHQSHYEQFGVMTTQFTINKESYEFKLPSFRDHSFGHKRDWSLMHRYAFHHIFLENHTSICVGVISQPTTASEFEVGEVCLPSGRIEPVRRVGLRLYQHGEGGHAPIDYAFMFHTADSVYHVQVLVEYESVHYKGSEGEARLVERFCKYVVNGVRGRGVSEFQYRRAAAMRLQFGDRHHQVHA